MRPGKHTSSVPQPISGCITVTAQERAAARRSKANTVTPRAQSRREDCSVAAAVATVLLLLLLLLLLPLHLSSVESLSRNSACRAP
jgi:hypothetical protein